MKRVALALALSVLFAPGASADNLESVRVSGMIEDCRTQYHSNAEISHCFDRVIGILEAQLKHKIASRRYDLSSKIPPEFGGQQSEDAMLHTLDGIERLWSLLLEAECTNLVGIRNYGGQGVGMFSQHCTIGFLAARLDIMTSTMR